METDLIEDVWRKIFGLFNAAQLAPLASVCKRWKSIILSPLSWKSINWIVSADISTKKQCKTTSSFINFFLRYCPSVEDVILRLRIEKSNEGFLDQFFQIRSLRRVYLEIGFDGYFNLSITHPPLCKDLKFLRLDTSSTLPGIEILFSGLSNIEELYLGFFNKTPEVFSKLTKLRRLSMQMPDEPLFDFDNMDSLIEKHLPQVKLVALTQSINSLRGRFLSPEPKKFNDTLRIFQKTFDRDPSAWHRYFSLVETFLDPIENGSILSNTKLSDDQVTYLVKTRGFNVNFLESLDRSFRPKLFRSWHQDKDYPLKSAVLAGRLDRISLLISLGADPNSPLEDDSPLLRATSEVVYDHLLKLGSDPNKLVKGIPAFMYLLLRSTNMPLLTGQAILSPDRVIPFLVGRCDFNKKYRGLSFVDIVTQDINAHQTVLWQLMNNNLINWRPDQLDTLLKSDSFGFNQVISRPGFDVKLLSYAALVKAYEIQGSEALRHTLMNQQEYQHDEDSLTVVHYMPLISTGNGHEPIHGRGLSYSLGPNQGRWDHNRPTGSLLTYFSIIKRSENAYYEADPASMMVDSNAHLSLTPSTPYVEPQQLQNLTFAQSVPFTPGQLPNTMQQMPQHQMTPQMPRFSPESLQPHINQHRTPYRLGDHPYPTVIMPHYGPPQNAPVALAGSLPVWTGNLHLHVQDINMTCRVQVLPRSQASIGGDLSLTEWNRDLFITQFVPHASVIRHMRPASRIVVRFTPHEIQDQHPYSDMVSHFKEGAVGVVELQTKVILILVALLPKSFIGVVVSRDLWLQTQQTTDSQDNLTANLGPAPSLDGDEVQFSPAVNLSQVPEYGTGPNQHTPQSLNYVPFQNNSLQSNTLPIQTNTVIPQQRQMPMPSNQHVVPQQSLARLQQMSPPQNNTISTIPPMVITSQYSTYAPYHPMIQPPNAVPIEQNHIHMQQPQIHGQQQLQQAPARHYQINDRLIPLSPTLPGNLSPLPGNASMIPLRSQNVSQIPNQYMGPPQYSMQMPTVTGNQRYMPHSNSPAQYYSSQSSPDYFFAQQVSREEQFKQVLQELIVRHKDAINIRSELGETPLLVLCKSSAAQRTKNTNAEILLKHGADVNLADNHGWTPLHAALYSSDWTLAELLLSYGANVNAQDEMGVTPVMAWFYGYNDNAKKMFADLVFDNTIKLLQCNGIDFSLTDKYFNRSVAHLMACVTSPDLFDVMMKNTSSNVMLEARDNDGFTPLHHAAMFCNYDMISYLIERGANVNAQSSGLKLTPLMILFAINNNVVLLTDWLKHCNVMLMGSVVETDIPRNANAKQRSLYQLTEPGWIQAKSRKSRSTGTTHPLCHNDKSKYDWREYLPSADLSLTDSLGNTLLHMVVMGQGKQLLSSKPAELHELNFLWNHRNANGDTPFHLLINSCEVLDEHEFSVEKMISLIETNNINLNVENNDGKSALRTLLSMQSLSLQEKNNLFNIAKKGPPHVPSIRKSIASISLLHSMLQTARVSIDLDLVKSITMHNVNEINAQDEDGNTPLMVLLRKFMNNEQMKYEVEVSKKQTKRNAYHMQDSDDEVENEEDDYGVIDVVDLLPIMRYLITCPGADLNIQNNSGDTTLHIVCRQFHVGALEAMLCNLNTFEQASKYCLIAFKLLDGGAQVMIKNNAGETAIDYAPMLMSHYQHVYPLIKQNVVSPAALSENIRPTIRSRTEFGSEYDLSVFESLEANSKNK